MNFLDALSVGTMRLFLGSVAFFTLANRAMLVIIGYQIYRLTHSPAALGWLGLVEAIPAIGFAFFGGYVADYFDRKVVLLLTRLASLACALILAYLSANSTDVPLVSFYAVIFMAGVARGFQDPASAAFEAQVVPRHLLLNASTWFSSVWMSCLVLGPVLVGFGWDAVGDVGCYLLIASGFLLSWLLLLGIKPSAQVAPEKKEPVWEGLRAGTRFVFSNQALSAALMLDLFAVLFGGAVALLPIFATDILQVGAKGLGFLNAAASLGALVTLLYSTHKPPAKNTGIKLLWCVGGFGVSILVFAFSKNFYLSLLALFCSGLFDGLSVVIRRSMIRLLSPESLRGRIAATNGIFVNASNELGAFESGMLAAWIGVVPCVAVGGAVTLGVVAICAWRAPQLVRLQLSQILH